MGEKKKRWQNLMVNTPGRAGAIPALRRQRQENHKFKDSLGYIVRHCLKKKKVLESISYLTALVNELL
jgi:hypothetical protein